MLGVVELYTQLLTLALCTIARIDYTTFSVKTFDMLCIYIK